MADTHTAYTDTDTLIQLLDAAETLPAPVRLRTRSYQLLRLPPGATVVDVGCGTARAVAELAEAGAHAIGVDLNPAMLAAARRRFPDLDLRAADATDLPLRDGQAHGYRADKVYHVLPDPHAALAEARRVLVEVHTAVFTDATALPILVGHATAAHQTGAVSGEEADDWVGEQTRRAQHERLLVAIPMFLATATR